RTALGLEAQGGKVRFLRVTEVDRRLLPPAIARRVLGVELAPVFRASRSFVVPPCSPGRYVPGGLLRMRRGSDERQSDDDQSWSHGGQRKACSIAILRARSKYRLRQRQSRAERKSPSSAWLDGLPDRAWPAYACGLITQSPLPVSTRMRVLPSP